MLDDMARFFGDSNGYPQDRYQQLLACFDKWEEPYQSPTYTNATILKAQDASWRAFLDMYETGGVDGTTQWDPKDRNYQWIESIENKSGYFGGDIYSGNRKYMIVERCNYVSNVAMYHSTIRICEYDDQWSISPELQATVMKSFATLAVSSAFFHGSMSYLGGQWDGKMVGVTIFNAYTILIRSVETDSLIFKTLINTTTEPIDIIDVTNKATYFPLDDTLSLGDWWGYLETLPTKTIDYEKGGVAIVAFALSVVFPWCIAETIINLITPSVLEEKEADFIKNEYIPELKTVADQEGYPIPIWRGLPLLKQIIGVLSGIVYATLFQETVIPLPCMSGPIFNTTRLGAWKTPMVNFVLELFTGNTNPIQNAYNGEEEYPGAKFCNRDSPHALWHQLSADALVDLFVAVDYGSSVLLDLKEKKQQKASQEGGGWFSSIASSFQNLDRSRGDDGLIL